MPEVTIKTLQQKVFKAVVEDSDTIATLKQKIEADQGFAVNTQKLIFSGKILADDRTIESLQIKEKDFLVVMVSKPKPQPATPKKDEAKVEQPAQKSEQPEQPEQPQQPQQPQQPVSSSTPSQPGNNLAMGSELETAVSNMVEMGFDRAQVMKAMRASFNNPERAVEYLMTGIPQHLQQPEQSEQPQQQSEQQTDQPTGAPLNLFDAARQQSSPAAGQAAPGGDGQQAQLAELVQAAQENPALLQSLIQEIAQSNPTLAQLLAQNPQALLDLLSGEGAEGDFQDEDGPGQVIHLTEEQAEAVARLEALGFSREMSAQALLACEGNEELAANYLFEQQEDL